MSQELLTPTQLLEDDETKPVATKKRSRSATKKPALQNVGSAIVCSYSGQACAKCVIVPGLKGVAFSCLPCARSYLEEHVKDDARRAKLFADACELYGQTVDNVPFAPDRTELVVYGGQLSADEWASKLGFWLGHTDRVGQTLKQLQQKSQRKGGNGKAAAFVFEPGSYIVRYNRKTADEVNCLKVPAERVEGTTYLPLSKALKAPEQYKKKCETPLCVTGLGDDSYFALVCVPQRDGIVDMSEPEHRNALASALTGQNVYGNAFVHIFKKKSVPL